LVWGASWVKWGVLCCECRRGRGGGAAYPVLRPRRSARRRDRLVTCSFGSLAPRNDVGERAFSIPLVCVRTSATMSLRAPERGAAISSPLSRAVDSPGGEAGVCDLTPVFACLEVAGPCRRSPPPCSKGLWPLAAEPKAKTSAAGNPVPSFKRGGLAGRRGRGVQRGTRLSG